ncbi:MMPL family transporter [Rhodococcus sp. USK13]|uniref:MMPL family transporter n=1 Tax=Rhodococcus sp. USK13 TaxID=2806442 RepID=UPI001BD1A7DB|nr:MMPL family transporter [Rhodococcus sp. USK13]
MLRRLATLIVSFPRRVLAVAVALLVLSAIFGAGVSEHLKVGGFDDPGSESAQAERFLEAEFGTASPNLVLQVTARSGDVNTPDVAAAAQQLRRSITSEPDITEVASYWVANSPELRSTDGRSALLLLHVGGNPEQAARRTHTLVEALPSDDPAIEVVAGGKLGLTDAIEQQVADDLLLAESIAVPATLVLLVVAFGSVVAALLPLTLGIISILATMVVLFGLAQITDVSVYALTVATAFGLGLAIDFGLLLVSRFREERAAGRDPQEAVVDTVTTAGRTIVFSAATVMVAMTGMLVFPTYFLRSVGLAAMAVVAVAALGAVVVLPALLAVLGTRVDRLTVLRRKKTPASDSLFWRRTAAAVTRRPVRTALPVVALLLVLGIPFLHAQYATPDERALPSGSAARQVTVDIRENYSAGADAVTVPTPQDGRSLGPLAREISTMTDVARVDGVFGRYEKGDLVLGPGPESARFAAGEAGFLLVQPSVGAQSEAAQDLVRAIRDLPAVTGDDLAVGGPTATLIDSRTAIMDRLPLAIGLMAVATFVLLFLFTGSVILPLKALVLNVFTLSAVVGAMVWVFQDGHLAWLTGATPAPLNIGMVVLLCCIAFALSVDYEIFLLSRIKEAHDAGASTTEATIEGLGRVGRIVSSAAALLTVTLLSFSTGLSFMQMFGIGTALAIIVDATLIRGVLVPAFMQIAGDLNWWAPRPLRWLHTRIGLSDTPGSGPPEVTDPAAAPAAEAVLAPHSARANAPRPHQSS